MVARFIDWISLVVKALEAVRKYSETGFDLNFAIKAVDWQ
jgi:hypothetical protein